MTQNFDQNFDPNFDPKLRVKRKLYFLGPNLIFEKKFPFWTTNAVSDENVNFGANLIFDQKFGF